jgi:hypothetical protein
MKRTLLMMTIVAFLSYGIQAAPCASGNLASYETTPCNIGGLNFSGFDYIPAGSAPAAKDVTVTPITGGSEIGLLFSAAWLAGPGQTEDSLILYSANCVGCSIADLVLGLVFGGASGTGIASAGEASMNPVLSLITTPSQPTDMITFSKPVGSLSLAKDIALIGGDGVAHISAVSNLFSLSGTTPPIPEPSLLLLCLGLCALVPVARRRFGRKVSG